MNDLIKNGIVNNKLISKLKLDKSDITFLLGSFLDNILYKFINFKSLSSNNDLSIKDNSDFWSKIIQRDISNGQKVVLSNFDIVEWIPQSPGLFHTSNALNSRMEAEYFVNEQKYEYLPLGKYNMIQGGIGSIRISEPILDKNFLFSSNPFYFLGATSNGISHCGIPILIEKDTYNKIIPRIKEKGSCKATIIAQLINLPLDKSLLNYQREIPKYCLLCEDLKDVSHSVNEIGVSIAVAYRNSNFFSNNQKDLSWTFMSFEPDKKEQNLYSAVDRINDYILRHLKKDDYFVVNSFDDKINHFNNKIDFSLNNLFNNTLNEEMLKNYGKYLVINYTNINGSNNTVVQDSNDVKIK